MIQKIIFISLLWTSSAFAAFPPPGFILSQAVKAHEGLKTLALEGRITDIRTNQVFKEVLKIDFISGRVNTSFLGVNDEPMGGLDTQIKGLHRLGKFWLSVAMDPNAARMQQSLQELNIAPNDKTVVKPSRIGTLVTWSWGEDDEIQFIKDQFLAADYRSGGIGPASQEILLKDYAASAVRIPRNVFVKLQGKDVYRFELKGLKVNPVLKYPSSNAAILQPNIKEWTLLVR